MCACVSPMCEGCFDNGLDRFLSFFAQRQALFQVSLVTFIVKDSEVRRTLSKCSQFTKEQVERMAQKHCVLQDGKVKTRHNISISCFVFGPRAEAN